MARSSFKDTIIFIYVHFRYPIGLEYANGQWVGVASGWLSTVIRRWQRWRSLTANARKNGLNRWTQSSSSYDILDFAFLPNWLVVQAALFTGFLSAFLIELLCRLKPDPMDTIQDVLIYQTQMMHNSSLGPYVLPDFLLEICMYADNWVSAMVQPCGHSLHLPACTFATQGHSCFLFAVTHPFHLLGSI